MSNLLGSNSSPSPDAISTVLSETISSFDASITADLLSLFPGGEEVLKALSDDDVKAVINDQDRGGKNAAIVARCMRGTTALIILVDPEKSNAWVASLGDCVAGKPFFIYLPHAQAGKMGRIYSPRLFIMQKIAILMKHVLSVVLGSTDRLKERADGIIISSTHNGKVKEESVRIKEEHPGEEDVMLRDRVCGAIAVTRGRFNNRTQAD